MTADDYYHLRFFDRWWSVVGGQKGVKSRRTYAIYLPGSWFCINLLGLLDEFGLKSSFREGFPSALRKLEGIRN
jgi:hypothetical protein